jgi:hypothetical protein
MFARIVVVLALAVLAVGPIARSSGGAHRPRDYRVRAGDTLWSIAVRNYGGEPPRRHAPPARTARRPPVIALCRWGE